VQEVTALIVTLPHPWQLSRRKKSTDQVAILPAASQPVSQSLSRYQPIEGRKRAMTHTKSFTRGVLEKELPKNSSPFAA